MERERVHEKIEKILHNMNINNLLESIDSFEFYLKQIKRKNNEIFIPQEANFQLPNQFLDLHQNNEIEKVSIKKAKLDDIFVVLPGEKVALDGIVIEGTSYLDTSSLTGESTPRKATVNDLVLSGTINKDSILKVKATSTYKTSTATRIIDLI